MSAPGRLYHLALRDWHAAAGAVFVEREGWSVPGHFGDPEAEHDALRNAAAVFDRSHRSRIMVTGTDAGDLLARSFAGRVGELEEGRAMRTVALDDTGHIRDLALVARSGAIAYMVSGEPGQRFETLARLQSAIGAGFDVRVDDRTESTCFLGLAGPASSGVAREHLAEGLPSRIAPLQCLTFEFHGFRALAVRTSDTGEDGFELMLAPAVAQHVVETLRAAGIALAGDSAQQVARVEACIPAFAPDLEPGLSPAEADLDILLNIPGGPQGRILAAVLLECEAPIAAGTLLTFGGQAAGELRSSVWSQALGATIGLAILDARLALPGRALDASGIRATIVAKPFYRRRS